MHRPTPTHRRPLGRVVAALLLCCAAGASAATFVATASTHTLPVATGDASQSASGHAPVQAGADSTGARLLPNGGEESAVATVRTAADMGGVHLYATTGGIIAGASFADFASPVAQAKGSASMGDSFTLFAPGLATGVMLSARIGLSVAGALSAEGLGDGVNEARSSWNATLSVLGSNGQVRLDLDDACFSSNTSPGLHCFGDPFGFFTVGGVFANGSVVSFSIQGNISSSVNLSGTDGRAVSTANLGHTIAWGGITELRDAQGNLLSGYTALSTSNGYDYVKPFASAVPEPSGAALLLAGLAAVGGLARRRSS